MSSDVYARYGYEPDDELWFMMSGEPIYDEAVADKAVVHIRTKSLSKEHVGIDFILGRIRSICGVTGSVYNHISEFDDSQLCRRCMKQLGDQTLRVFERDW